MKANRTVAPNASRQSVERPGVRYIAACTLPTLLLLFSLGFLNPGLGVASQGGPPPGQGNPQDGAVVSPPPGPDNAPKGQDAKLAAVAAASKRGERQALRRHLQDADAAVQAAAFNALAAEDATAAIQDLLAILQDTDHPTRWQALWLLDQSLQADQEVVMAALRDALRDADPLVSDYALQALAARQDAHVVSGSLGSPETDPQAARLAATHRAASGGDRQALRSQLQDVDAAVQAAAFDALAAQDTDAAVGDLVATIRDATNPVRWQSLQLLDESLLGDEATVGTLLIDALNEADPLVRGYALLALARRAPPEGMNALTQAFQDSDAVTRLAVIDAMGQTEAGLQFLREALSDSDETVRDAAAARLTKAAAAAGQAE